MESHKKSRIAYSVNHVHMVTIQKENDLLKKILDEIPMALYWKDLKGAYLGFNQRAFQQYLKKVRPSKPMIRGEGVGKTDHDLFMKEVADEYRKNDLFVMSEKKELVIEEILTAENGEQWTQLSTKKPLCDGEGNVIGVMGVSIDITDHKKTQELKSAQKKAGLANSTTSKRKRR